MTRACGRGVSAAAPFVSSFEAQSSGCTDVNSLSPPRDVIILVDLSGSMRAGSAITHAINSAQYIIERLNVADSFAVVAFGTRVQQIYPEGGGMVKGNLENTANAAGAVHRPVCRGMRVHILMRRCHQVRSPTSRRRARR